jgi:1-acyl-sn-glycerol-3-phosphate acyltransferase
MQNVVIAKPYEFVPPDRRWFWPAVFRPLLRPFLAKVYGVTTVEIVGIESLRSALRERASVLLVPNHCRPCDPTVVAVLGAQAGTPLYTMASWHQFMGRRSMAWILRRIGAFSVYREGLDRAAIRTAIELLVEARRPLAIFPEGIITRSNDRLGALYEGPAFIAHSAAKQRARNEPGARTLLIPVALRYRFLGRLDESGVRALRTAIVPELVEGGLSDAERDRRWDQLTRLNLAQRLSLYPPGYLDGHPSTERVLETVERLEEDLTDVATVHRPIAVTVSVGEPLVVAADGPRPAALTNEVRDRIESLLNIRSASDRAPAPAEPTSEYR